MRKKLALLPVLFLLGGCVWFKIVMIPHVSFRELYLNAKQAVGLQSMDDVPGLKERIERMEKRKKTTED